MKSLRNTLFITVLIAIYGCGGSSETAEIDVQIDTLSIDRHLAILASDDFMGRKPFTEGEEKTIYYLESELRPWEWRQEMETPFSKMCHWLKLLESSLQQ